MLQPKNSTGNPPAFQRRLRARRDQQAVGLLPPTSPTGFIVVGCCPNCDELVGASVTIDRSRGDRLRWPCPCGGELSTTLGAEFPLAPLGSDAAPVDGSDGAR